MTERRTAILAGGCFWWMQELIHRQPGVVSTKVGYTVADPDRRLLAITAATPRPSRSSTIPRAPITGHWDAPTEHRHYLQRNPDGDSCHFPRPGWKLPKR